MSTRTGRRDRGPRPAQALRRASRRCAGIDFRVERGRGLRAARAQRRRQDDDGRDPRGLPRRAPRGEVSRARLRPRAPRARRCASASGSCCRAAASTGTSPCARRVAHWAGFYPHPRDVDEVIALAGLEGKADEPHAARSRAASCAGSTSRSRWSATPSSSSSTSRRPASTRPRGAPRGRPSARSRELGKTVAADHPLPRRGAGARRPRGDHQGRADPRRGRAGRARRRGRALPGRLARRATATIVERDDRRPDRAAARADRRRRSRAASGSRT